MIAVTLYCAKISGNVALRSVTVPRIDDGLLPPDNSEINEVMSADDSESTLSINIFFFFLLRGFLRSILSFSWAA